MATAETTLLALVSTEREILPKRLKSVHYNLIIQPHLEEATEFDGTMNARDNQFLTEDKIGLTSDALAIAGSGFSKTSGILTLLETFEEETSKKTNIFVWKEALRNLDIIIQNWDFENKPVQDGLKKFRTRLVSKCLKKEGYNFKDSDNTVEHMFKALHSSNGGEYPKVMKAANETFQPFLAGEYIAININVQEPVFAIALKHGGTKEYEAIQNALKTVPSIDKCNICLGPLGFCPKPKLILHTRSHALSPYVLAINETDRVLEPLVKLAAGKTALWEWFKSNINEIKEKVGGVWGRFAQIVQLCTANLSTREQFEDVESFFEDKDTDEYNVYLAQSLGMISARAIWVETDLEDVKELLEKNCHSKAG